tara:strand:+ start:21611 stop:22573 length:963 start_codon:yes stop_codon:yes gene_type:complete
MFSTSAQALTKINGAGATFPYPIYSKWFSEYQKVNKDVQFNYQSIGSGGGIRQVLKETVDFGATDAPMLEKEMSKAKSPITHIPTVLGAVTVAYNLPEVSGDLKLDAKTLVNIFLGTITKWNHKDIANLNPEAKLPAKDILPVYRADGSGTTNIFTDYMSAVSKDFKEKVGVGKAVSWPVGIGGKGNEGVTNMVKQTPGSIGYIELAYALNNNLKTVAIKNRAGKFVSPTIEGISASAAKADLASQGFKGSIVNADGDEAYPISAFTYILLPTKPGNAQLEEVKKFLIWALTDGQSFTKELHYAPLPKALADQLLEVVKR